MPESSNYHRESDPTRRFRLTGTPWLDAAAFALFVGLALVLAAQLVRAPPGATDPSVTALHLVMALGMAAMSQPRFDPLVPEVWMVAFLGSAAATLAPGAWRRGRAGRPPSRPYGHAAASLLMVVGFAADAAHGAGPGTHAMTDPATGAATAMANAAMSGHQASTGSLASTVGAVAAWPVWPLVGLGFAACAPWLTARLVPAVQDRSRPACRGSGRVSERVGDAVMAAGMAFMALTL